MSIVEITEFINQLMDQVQILAKTHIHLAPFIIGGMLLLAGLNLPISEDLMIFITAMVAINNPEYTLWLYFGLLFGALGSDFIAYWTGRLLGPQLFHIPMFKRVLNKDKLHRMAHFYNRYGMWVLLVGRFIPFGVRNVMFITAGLGRSHFGKFALADLVAAFISVTSYFLLFYHFGEAMLDAVRRFNIILFVLFLVTIVVLLIRRKRRKDKPLEASLETIDKIEQLSQLKQNLKKEGQKDTITTK